MSRDSCVASERSSSEINLLKYQNMGNNFVIFNVTRLLILLLNRNLQMQDIRQMKNWKTFRFKEFNIKEFRLRRCYGSSKRK